MHTIIICDDNVNSLESLSLAIRRDPQFEIVAQASDGKTAISLIERCRPEIIILDVVLPEYDGVYIVNHVRKNIKDYDPIIYILSGLGTDPIVRALNELCIDFYSMKPVAMSVVVQNLDSLVKQRSGVKTAMAFNADADVARDEMIENAVKNMLLYLGIMPHRTASKCVAEALIIYIDEPGANRMLTKIIYPKIAKKYGLNGPSVEKNIRTAISHAQKTQTLKFNEIFSYSTKKHITNGEFLSVMSDYISKSLKISRPTDASVGTTDPSRPQI